MWCHQLAKSWILSGFHSYCHVLLHSINTLWSVALLNKFTISHIVQPRRRVAQFRVFVSIKVSKVWQFLSKISSIYSFSLFFFPKFVVVVMYKFAKINKLRHRVLSKYSRTKLAWRHMSWSRSYMWHNGFSRMTRAF
jgi:hypothetical protein